MMHRDMIILSFLCVIAAQRKFNAKNKPTSELRSWTLLTLFQINYDTFSDVTKNLVYKLYDFTNDNNSV